MTDARERAEAALARADAWGRPRFPTEASELLDYEKGQS